MIVFEYFGMNHPRDLFAKLGRDLEALQSAPNSKDAAFNFFVTAEHLLDWIHPGSAGGPGGTARNALRQSEPILQVVSHLANGSKHHAGLSDKHVAVIRAETASKPPAFRSASARNMQIQGGRQYVNQVHLKLPIATSLGIEQRVHPLELAKMAYAYWAARPEIQ